MNHYEVLGVAPDSGTDEIRRAYLALARRFHPDYHVDADDVTRAANARKMQELNQAWGVLSQREARGAYDRELLLDPDPGVARRAAREPDMPAGKGWTPRSDDDGWMSDFDAWADEEDTLPPDTPRSAGRNFVTTLPIGLLAAGIGSVFLGVVVKLNELVALGGVCVILALGLFVMLPMYEMSRGRRR